MFCIYIAKKNFGIFRLRQNQSDDDLPARELRSVVESGEPVFLKNRVVTERVRQSKRLKMVYLPAMRTNFAS